MPNQLISGLRCFTVKSVLSRFTRFLYGEKITNMMYGDEPPIYCRLTGVRKTEQEKRDRGINVSNVLGTPIEYTTIETYVGKKIESS